MTEQGKCTSDDELRLEYLLDKEKVCPLDKAERYELQQLINEEV